MYKLLMFYFAPHRHEKNLHSENEMFHEYVTTGKIKVECKCDKTFICDWFVNSNWQRRTSWLESDFYASWRHWTVVSQLIM